jgi:hypothetical protein
MDVYASKARGGPRQASRFAALPLPGDGLASAIKGGTLASSDTNGEVNKNHIAVVTRTAQTSPIVRAVLEKVLSDTVDCRFSIRLKYGEKMVELPESEKRLVETAWPSFVREVLWHILVVGFVVVAADKRRHVPRVVPLQYCRVMFHENVKESRTYWAEEPVSSKRLDALVFAKYHPTSEGILTSPAASVLTHAQRYDRVLANNDDADYQATHPVWTFQSEKQGVARPDTIEHDEIFDGEVYEKYAGWHAQVASIEMDTFTSLQTTAARGYQEAVARAMRAPGAAAVPVGAQSAPYLNSFFVPTNQSLVAPPRPTHNPHFGPELEMLETRILQSFRVPPTVLESTLGVRFASQPETGLAQWGATVRSTQRELAALIADCYVFTSSDVFTAYAEAILGDVAKRQEEMYEAVAKRTKTKKTTGDDEGGADGENKERVGAPITNDQGELQLPESDESLKRAAQVLSVTDADVIAHLRARFGIDVEFHSRPTLRMDELRNLYDLGLISHDTFAEKAAEITGLSPALMLVGFDAKKKDAKERKQIQDILSPPEEKPVPDGAPGKPKRKAPSD